MVAGTGGHRRGGRAAAAGLAAAGVAAAALAAAPVPAVAIGAGALLGGGLGVLLAHIAPLVVARAPGSHLGRVQGLLGVARSAALVGPTVLSGVLADAAGAVAGLLAGAGALGCAALLAARVGRVAEADGNRTRLAEVLGHVGVEDRGGHQAP